MPSVAAIASRSARPDVPVLYHVAHRAFLNLGMVEMHEEGRWPLARAAIRNLDLKNVLAVVCYGVPNANSIKQSLRGQRHRVAAPVKGRVLADLFRERVDHGDTLSGLCEGEGENGAGQPAADDQDIAVMRHVAQYGRVLGDCPCVVASLPSEPRGRRAGHAGVGWTRVQRIWGRAIGAGEVDPVNLTQAFLERIKAHELSDRIYARLTEDRAMAEAQAASVRAKAGARLSLLDGVPISWKDLFDTAGDGTEAGSKLLAGRVPDRDAVVLQNATAMGLVCLGKTHLSELAFSGLGYNPSTATPPCVNDVDAVPGGSSSGAAASVAFGLAPAAIGSDTGGWSVRIPSAWNDLVGLEDDPWAVVAGRVCAPVAEV